jgi:hypothetical protein
MAEVLQRRYRCQEPRCGAVVVVVPAAVRRRFMYSAAAIAMALALWGAQGQSAAEVRAAVSVNPIAGLSARGWRSLGRWVRRARELFPPV